MRFVNEKWILATGDLTKFVRCEHATFLDHAMKNGTVTPLARRPPSPWTDLIAAKGDAHERGYVADLEAAGKTVVAIERPEWFPVHLRRAEEATVEAMRRGVDFIDQAAFYDGRWVGYADLLQRVDKPSPLLGDWSYEVVDTKLARSVQAHFLLQLSDYSAHLTRLQGCAPESMHVVVGTRERVSFAVNDYAAYYRHVRSSVDAFLLRGDVLAPYPVEFCTLCTWSAHCRMHWEDIDHLSLVANIRRTQVARLENGGVATLAALAESPATLQVRRMPAESLGALQHQARMQLEHRRTGTHRFELLPLEPDRGFLRLPRPSAGDLFFDVEGDPFVGEGITFLFGVAWSDGAGPQYRAWWAHDEASEGKAFAEVVDFLTDRCKDATAHVYHYGAMEVATLKRLAGRHATHEDALDDLLRREAFVDLAAVVRQSMRISHSGYGLKKVETFYFERTEEAVADAGGAVLAYEQWLLTNDVSMLEAIGRYNREDCVSLLRMQDWLARIKPEDAPWKEVREPRAFRDARAEEDEANDALYARLIDRLPLLAHLLHYHRREERPQWWWYFERQRMTPDELFDDGESIARITLDSSVAPVVDKRSKIFTYRFPTQEHKFGAGDTVFDARDGESAGEVVSIEDATGVLRLRRGPKFEKLPHPEAIIPKPKVNSAPVRAAIRRFATAFLENDPPYRAGVDILLNRAPRVRDLAAGETLADPLDITRRLDDSYLFVQGPPGSGKTHTGARLIVDLLRSGKRVGVTSNSHKAIHNLLDAVEAAAREQGFWFRGLKKKSSGADDTEFVSRLPNPMIESTDDNDDCANPAMQLVAGTAWLFSDPDLDRSLDYLFIDEAGQVSLANAIAVSTATRNLVLLGDPLQLAQVSQGAHPDHAGDSVLQHLLGTHATVPPDRGIFLAHTWRMHPSVCAFVSEIVYESRLLSADECANQAVTVDDVVKTGLRFLPVAHVGNSQSSEEEAQAIVGDIRAMLRGTYTSSKGATVQLRAEHILVVAAYNAQVRRISATLAAAGLGDIPVGTVDKFQGRQAPVVYFSMATSSGAELPRDIEFLFSRNRLNVAMSRARCVATLVASPRLLDVACKTPEQMKLVNSLCRFVEMATTTD